jgi:hypothetical protein
MPPTDKKFKPIVFLGMFLSICFNGCKTIPFFIGIVQAVYNSDRDMP